MKATLLKTTLLTMLVLPAFCQPPTPAPDVNRDGIVDYNDLIFIQEYWHTGEKHTATPTPTPAITLTPTVTPTLGNFTLQIPGEGIIEFKEIPPGNFQMGLPDYGSSWNFCFEIDAGLYDCARPVHDVTIEYAYYIGKTEVTRSQWFAVMGSLPSQIAADGPDTRPVNYVSWSDAQDFVSMLNNLGQGTFRLPSEAEWEYACRAGTTTRFYFGDSNCEPKCYDDPCLCDLADYAWYTTINGQYPGPEPVGQKFPNAWNLYGMHGNVREFCQDDWHDGFTGAPTDGSAWVDEQILIVMRGGSYLDDPIMCQSAARSYGSRVGNGPIVGFRVVREKD